MFQNLSHHNGTHSLNRTFTDNPTTNNLYYRDSESHARITQNQSHLRDNSGPGTLLYTNVHSNGCYCEDHENRNYLVK